MKHRAHQTSYRNNSGFKTTVSTVVAVPITYDEQKKIYKFKEKKQVPGTSQDTGIPSKQLRHTCDKLSIADQAVRPGGANLVIPTYLYFHRVSFTLPEKLFHVSGY